MSRSFTNLTDVTLDASKVTVKVADTGVVSRVKKFFGKSDSSSKYKSDIPGKPNKLTKPNPKVVDDIQTKFKDINSIKNLDDINTKFDEFKTAFEKLDDTQKKQLKNLNEQFEKQIKTIKFDKKVDDFYENTKSDIYKNGFFLEPDKIKNKINDLKSRKQEEFKTTIINDPIKPKSLKLDTERFNKIFDDYEKSMYRINENAFFFDTDKNFNKLTKLDDITPNNIDDHIEEFKKFKQQVSDDFKKNIKDGLYDENKIKDLFDKIDNYEKGLNQLDNQFKNSTATKTQTTERINETPDGTPEEKNVAEQVNNGKKAELNKNQIDETKKKLGTESDPKKAYSKLKTLGFVSGVAAIGIAAYIIFSQSKAEVQSSTDYKILSITKESNNKTLIQYEPADAFIEGLNIQITQSNSYPTVNGYYKIINPKAGILTIDAKIVDPGDKGIIKYLIDFNRQFNYELDNAKETLQFLDTEEDNQIPTTEDSNKILGLDKTLFIIIVITLIIFILLSSGLALFFR